MKKIVCENIVLDPSTGESRKCGRVLGAITDMQLDILRVDPEGGPIFRCPKCPSEQRWFQVCVDKAGKTSFNVIDHPELEGNVIYDDLNICQQIG